MTSVEQAIFTSAKTDRAVGYQVIAHSPGLNKDDVRELAVWCPSHDSLLQSGAEAVSLNFHPLPSGSYCVSRTVPAGWEYSGRGGVRVYTHCLIVPAQVMARFADNPFAILHAALAAGAMEIRNPLPTRLESQPLVGGATPVDQTLLVRLSSIPGPRAMAILVQAALDAACLAVISVQAPSELFLGLMNCLPPACRRLISFSTGLKFSLRRPFHLIALSGDPSEQRWMSHQNNVTVLDLTGRNPLPSIPIDGWAQFIERALTTGQTSFLAAELSKRRFDLSLEDLPVLGLQLLEELEASTFYDTGRASAPTTDENDNLGLCIANSRGKQIPTDDSSRSADSSRNLQETKQPHAAHSRFGKTQIQAQNKAARLATNAPSLCLNNELPEVQEKLELLDDLVYDAISCRPGALNQLQAEWPAIRSELGEQMLAESREQYLRYALTIWEKCVEEGSIRNPSQAIQALDVLCLLFEE